ncbi:hypothetical protein [Chondrinema litorale]|uniref:hypothetical protein n=1 Tax=Chondrinema litorale TaxID=2994555 RepID=UPI002543B324|nr:hypothetical protein [Chondrinema litorale]UZR94866.1 hypothetical protein OQ292_03440 [Chondrinema litorale]
MNVSSKQLILITVFANAFIIIALGHGVIVLGIAEIYFTFQAIIDLLFGKYVENFLLWLASVIGLLGQISLLTGLCWNKNMFQFKKSLKLLGVGLLLLSFGVLYTFLLNYSDTSTLTLFSGITFLIASIALVIHTILNKA